MDRRIIKKIYHYYHNKKMTTRKVKQEIKKNYNVIIKESEITLMVGHRKNPIYYSDRQIRLILNLYKNCFTLDKLIEYLKNRHSIEISKGALVNLAHKRGVKKKTVDAYWQKTIGYEDEKEICRLYKKGISSKELANKYGFKSTKSIIDIVKKHNEEVKNPNLFRKENKSYFNFRLSLIDSEDKAYFLGLLLTDGYIDSRHNRIGIDLTDEDCISYLSERFHIPYTNLNDSIRNNRKKNRYRMVVYGEEHLQGISRLGLTDRKSRTLQGPNLYEEESKYIPSIIRGVIDGDGWIRKDGKEFFIVSASYSFIKWLKKSLDDLGFKNIKITTKEDDRRYGKVYLIRSASQYNINLLKTLVYNKPYGMQRKYNRLYQIQEGPSETIIEESQKEIMV